MLRVCLCAGVLYYLDTCLLTVCCDRTIKVNKKYVSEHLFTHIKVNDNVQHTIRMKNEVT